MKKMKEINTVGRRNGVGIKEARRRNGREELDCTRSINIVV
jgi:hypothetical protein